MNLAESLLHALAQAGAREIFGIPGDFALPFFDVVEKSKVLPLYTLSHEPAVGFAADAAARFHAKPSVAAVTYGAGAFNMVNPIAAAYAEKSPLIVVSGGPGRADRTTGLLVHHQGKRLRSQVEMLAEVTCAQAVLDDPTTAPETIARVLRTCLEESRPVYLEVPRDLVFEACGAVDPKAIAPDPPTDPEALDACATEILGRIEEARSPVLMVGVEIRRFAVEDRVVELARRLGIPVVTTFMGRGLFAGAEVPLRGTYLGVAGDAGIARLVETSDALVLLGVILSDTNFGLSEKKIDLRKTILACEGQVSLGYHVYPRIRIEALVEALIERLPAASDHVAPEPHYPHGLADDDAPIEPIDIATAVNDAFRAREPMPIAADMGDCLFTALDIENTQLVAPGYYATMGFGVPAGFGAQVATGLRPLVLVGDGAFQMTGWELLNCPRYGWDPVVLVFNNRSWEMLRAFQPESRFNDLVDLDFAAIAENLGGEGHRVRTRRELRQALEAALDRRGRFQLLDIRMERGVLSPSLARFVEGFRKMRGS